MMSGPQVGLMSKLAAVDHFHSGNVKARPICLYKGFFLKAWHGIENRDHVVRQARCLPPPHGSTSKLSSFQLFYLEELEA